MLFSAACTGLTAAVEALLRRGADPNATTSRGQTALMGAAAKGHAKIVAALLRGGAAVDVVNKNGETALMATAFCGDVECARLLLEAGADATLRATGHHRLTALEVAEEEGNAEVVALLRG